MEQQQQWQRLDGTVINGSIEEEVRSAILREKEKGYEMKVCIGTDSQVRGRKIHFATVIVLYEKEEVGLCISTMKL